MLIRPGRRAIAYAQIEPITISASTLPPVMIRLLVSERPSAASSHAVLKLARCSSFGNESGDCSASTSGFTAIITRK